MGYATSQDCTVAIDLGASSGRLIACTLEGNVLRSQELHRFENTIVERSGNFYWDVERLYANICDGLKKGINKSIKSVGVDAWGVDYILVDADGRILDKAFAYRDPRTNATYEQTLADIGREEIYRITGIQLMPINTLYQLKAHLDERPELRHTVKYILMIPDYLHYRLCGAFCNEFTNATTTQLLNCTTKLFDTKLLAYLGISAHQFPPMVQAGEALGLLNRETQRMTGLGSDVQVIAPGTHDTESAIASFIGDAETVYISSGTWSLIGAEIDAPIVSDAAMRYNLSNEGGVHGANQLLKNMTGLWIMNRVKAEIARAQSFDDITEQAQHAVPFQTIINPNAEVFLNPKNMTEAIQSYAKKTNQKVPKTVGAFARCIYESLALGYNSALAELEEVTQRKYTKINVIGGGSRNIFLNQLTADITQREVIAGPVETSSLGNAILQMISLKWIKDLQSAREIIAKSTVLTHYLPHDIPPKKAARFFSLLSGE